MDCDIGTTTGVIFDLSCSVSPPTIVGVSCSIDGGEAEGCKSVTFKDNDNPCVCGYGGLYTRVYMQNDGMWLYG